MPTALITGGTTGIGRAVVQQLTVSPKMQSEE